MTGRRTFTIALVALVILMPLLLLAWVATTGSGLRFAAKTAEEILAPNLQIQDPTGSLWGGVRIGKIVFTSPERQIAADDVILAWDPRSLSNRLLLIQKLDIGRLQVLNRPDQKKTEPPADLRLPSAVRIDAFHIGQIVLGELGRNPAGTPPLVSDLNGRFTSDGQVHQLDGVRFATSRLSVEGKGSLNGQSPFPADVKAEITGEELGHPFTVALEAQGPLRDLAAKARSRNGTLVIDANATLDLFAPQPLVRGNLKAVGLDPAAWVAGVPNAKLDIDGSITPEPGNQANLQGEISVINNEPGRLDEKRIPLRRFTAQLRQAGLQVLVPAFTATQTNGEARGSARWADQILNLEARLVGIDASAWHKALKKTRLSGNLKAQVSAASQEIQADLRDPRFRLNLDGARRDNILHINTARLSASGGSLEASGQIDPAGDYQLKGRLQDFDPSVYVDIPRGRLNALLDAHGQLGEKLGMDLHFSLGNSRFAGRTLAGQGTVVLRPDRLENADVALKAGNNTLLAKGKLGLPDDVMTINIDAPHLEDVGLGGVLRGVVRLSGALRTPAAQWDVTAPQLILPGGRSLRDLASKGEVAPGGSTLQGELAVARMDLGGKTPPLLALVARIEGKREQHHLRGSAKVGDGQAVEVAVQGGLDPNWVWRGEIDTLDWRGPYPVRLTQAAHLEAGAGHIVLGKAPVAGKDWQGTIEGLRWENGRLQSAGRFNGFPVATFLPEAFPPSSLRLAGEWDIDFGLRATGRVHIFRQEGDLSLKTGEGVLALGLQDLDAVANFTGHNAELALRAQGARAGSLEGRLTAGLKQEDGLWVLARQAPWQGNIRLDTPSVDWLSPLAGENVKLGGNLKGVVDIGGTPAVPATTGHVAGDGLRVRLLDYGLDLGGGVLRLDFTPEKARLQRLELYSATTQRPNERNINYRSLTANPGRLIAEGEMALQSGSARIQLRADHLNVSQLPDRWIMVSGTGDARLTEGRLAIAGNIGVDAAYLEMAPPGRPSLSNDVVVLGRDKAKRQSPLLRIDLNVNLGDEFYFRGAGIQSRLAGELRLTAERRDQLRAVGSVSTVDGIFDAYGRQLAIDRGILNFQGLVDNPGLNVQALRKNLPVEAGIEVTGTLKDPKVRLVSVPEVPDTEKLSWMVLGRPPGEAVGSQDADLLLSAAMALRGGGQGKGPLQSVMQGLGLEELSLSSGTLGERSRFPSSHVAGSFTPGGSVTAAEQIATVGKRIGSNAVLSYERSITTAESVLKLTIELTRRLSIVGRVGANNALGFLYTFSFGGGDKGGEAAKR